MWVVVTAIVAGRQGGMVYRPAKI
jgi:hypothetical protein